MLRDNVKEREKVHEKTFKMQILEERMKAKAKETFGVVICITQYACSLKSKKQKNESSVNLATKGIQLTSL